MFECMLMNHNASRRTSFGQMKETESFLVNNVSPVVMEWKNKAFKGASTNPAVIGSLCLESQEHSELRSLWRPSGENCPVSASVIAPQTGERPKSGILNQSERRRRKHWTCRSSCCEFWSFSSSNIYWKVRRFIWEIWGDVNQFAEEETAEKTTSWGGFNSASFRRKKRIHTFSIL